MKKNFHKIHIYVSLFFLPMALAYALTGALVIFGVNENSGAEIKTYEVRVDFGIVLNSAFILDFLKENNLKIPAKTELRENKKSGGSMMGGINYSVSLKAKNSTDSATIYELTTMERNLIGNMILLHKAKGEVYFNIIAVGFAIALAVLYLSGLIITSFCIRRRGKAIIAVGLGLVCMIFLGYLSV